VARIQTASFCAGHIRQTYFGRIIFVQHEADGSGPGKRLGDVSMKRRFSSLSAEKLRLAGDRMINSEVPSSAIARYT
jgi:hypothetical protein